MDDLRKEQVRLGQKADYEKAIASVDAMLDMLTKTRESIVADSATAPLHIAKCKGPMKKHFDEANDNLKQVNSALKGYEKALAKTFKTPFEDAETDTLSSQSYLVNRAIAMHLLREGQFDVASTFFREIRESAFANNPIGTQSPSPHNEGPTQRDWELRSEALQTQFAEMYHVLDELRNKRNLEPAIAWARKHSEKLESRGSNLEFELCRLHFVSIFLGQDHESLQQTEDIDMETSTAGLQPAGAVSYASILRAGAYAREAFTPSFQKRYGAEIHKLLGAFAFWENIPDSPYASLFAPATAWDEACVSFSREFCALLGLSHSSPLYVACTAGAMALPVLSKVKSIMRSKRTEWTTQEELPVEIPLPPQFRFHSIFVCPVSKEQATDKNPPVMLPCGHVLCRDSVANVSKGSRFKCPYCPVESTPREAITVYL